MRKVLILTAIFLTFIRPVNAGLVETYFDYAPTSTVTNTNLNGNFDNIRNVLNGGIDGDNVDSPNGWRLIEILSSPPAAGNQGRVVFDSSTNTLQFDTGSSFITTAVLPNSQTFTGNNTFSGTSTFNNSFIANGTTNTIGNGGSDILTLNVPGGITWTTGAGTWTLSGALTVSGTIADLGTVTTANIDGGTLDGVQIGGTTATGELIVNDSSDDADGLGSQGTSGQVLQSAGTGANPTWVDGMSLTSTTAISSGNSGDITIAASKVYKVVISLTNTSADDTVLLRVNSDGTGPYNWLRVGTQDVTAPTAVNEAGNGDTSVKVGTIDAASTTTRQLNAEILIDTFSSGSDTLKIVGNVRCFTTDSKRQVVTLDGAWNGNAAPTSFEILSSGGATLTGNIYLYQIKS